MARQRGNRPEKLPHPPRLYKLLGQVAKFYRRRFGEELRAREVLRDRGIEDEAALETFFAGYCDGSLRDVLPFDDQVHDDLRALGVLKENGKELLCECVVFPLRDLRGACVGMYGRRLFDSDVPHLYLPGARRGLTNWQAAKRDSELVLTESVIDALSLYAAGVTGAVPCYGTGGFTQDHAVWLERFAPDRIAICFDADEAGRKTAAEIAGQVEAQRRGSTVRVIELPSGMDANDVLVHHGPEALRRLIEPPPATSVEPASAPEPTTAPPSVDPASPAGATKPTFEKTAAGFVLHIAGRCYEAKAISKQGTQLRVTLKASKAKERSGRFELSTIDLYSRRSREWFAGLCGELFETDTASDMRAVVEHAEAALEDRAPKTDAVRVELSDSEKAEAMKLLQRPDLIDEILAAFEAVGYAEEVTNKQLGYLVAVSRKLERPLSLLIESRSSAGKSALQDAVLGFVPPEELCKYSRITDQALFYTAEDALEHKLLVIEEATGMGGGAYSIRALQSGDELRVASTGKDPATGKMRTEEYTVRARTAVMMTTTDPDFDEETKSRFIRATVNESSELTRRILDVQRQSHTIEGIALRRRAERIKTLHQNAQRLLESVTVANPFAPKLTFPAHSLQARRDNEKYLRLIDTVALLHQHQRPKKTATMFGERIAYIEATLDDVAIANRIAKEVLTSRHGDVTPQARQLFGLIRKMLLNGGGKDATGSAAFTRRTLREYSGWSDWQVRTHLGELSELEYLRVRQGQLGREYVYELSDTHLLETIPGFGLTDIAELGAVLRYDDTNPRQEQPTPRSKPGTLRRNEVTPRDLEAP